MVVVAIGVVSLHYAIFMVNITTNTKINFAEMYEQYHHFSQPSFG